MAWRPQTFAGCVSWKREPPLKADVCGSIIGDRALKDVIAKALKPAVKRELVVVLQTEHGLSERQACAAGDLPRAVYQYEPRPNPDQPVVKLLLDLA